MYRDVVILLQNQLCKSGYKDTSIFEYQKIGFRVNFADKMLIIAFNDQSLKR